jgi:mono/diheme cytochrome c family protein
MDMLSRPAFLAALLALATSAAAAEPDGAALYKAKCASCHGLDGRGETPVGKALKLGSLLEPRWAADDAPAAIAKAVREGVPGMPAMASKLSAAEIEAVAKATHDLAKAAQAP